MTYRIALLGLYLSLNTISVSATSIAYTKDVKLPTKQALALENRVCLKPHNLKAKTIQGSKDIESKAAFDTAFVQCQSHGDFKGKPMHYQSGCTFSNEKWLCNEDILNIEIQVNGKDMVMHPIGIAPESAYHILAKISTYGLFQGISMDDAIGSSCYITASKDEGIVELNCRSNITVSFWCPQPQLTNCPRIVYVSPRPL